MTPAEKELYEDLMDAFEQAFKTGIHPGTAREHAQAACRQSSREHAHKILQEDDQ